MLFFRISGPVREADVTVQTRNGSTRHPAARPRLAGRTGDGELQPPIAAAHAQVNRIIDLNNLLKDQRVPQYSFFLKIAGSAQQKIVVVLPCPVLLQEELLLPRQWQTIPGAANG